MEAVDDERPVKQPQFSEEESMPNKPFHQRAALSPPPVQTAATMRT
jgi:hypothetical protein